MQTITTLDDVAPAMGQDKPELVSKPTQPLSVDDAIALARPPKFNPASVPLCPLDAAMYGLRFDVKRKDGSTWHINPNGPLANIKEDDSPKMGTEAQHQLINEIIRAVIANRDTFGIAEVWEFSKAAASHLDYKTVTTYAETKLKELAALGSIRLINPLDNIYAR
jgi:hypothetical protein